MDSWELVARAAYQAYADSTGGKTHDGRDMPAWDALGARIQAAWQAAARASVLTARDIRMVVE